ncbi:MAG: AraC family transcriptional regulator [Deltaproteobacteria bacterium]|nr:AraC family transcriptional regulator [Deltaproteobacteria bacterium]
MLATFFLLMAVHGSFLAIVLYFGSTQDRTANRTLGHMVAALSLILWLHGLGVAGVRQHFPHLKEVDLALWFLIGPLTYSYVRRLCGQGRSRGERLLYLSFVGVVLALLPFFTLSAQEKIRLGSLYRTFGLPAVIAVTSLFTLMIFVSVLLARRALAEALEDHSPTDSDLWRFRWLRRLLAALAFYATQDALSGCIFAYFGFYPSWLLTVNFTGYALLLYGVAYLMVVHREGFLKPIKSAVQQKYKATLPSRTSQERDQARADVDRLHALLREEQLYRRGDLSLDALANRLEMSRHHLSQLINQEIGVSFHDLVNRYRIEEAKERLLGNSDSLGPLEIAAEAGFGSRASFYRAFKKHTGMTPRQFLLLRSSRLTGGTVEPPSGSPFPLKSLTASSKKRGPKAPEKGW